MAFARIPGQSQVIVTGAIMTILVFSTDFTTSLLLALVISIAASDVRRFDLG